MHLGAPLLLSGRDAVPASTIAEVQRLRATRVVLLGGPAALSEEVAQQLTAGGLSVERVAGANRFATAAAVTARLPQPDEVLVASGASFADALGAAALGAAHGVGVLLALQDELPRGTAAAVTEDIAVTVVGGPAAVGDTVVAALDERGADVRRLSGETRYGTSRAVAEEALARRAHLATTWVTTGRDFPDALVASAAAGHEGAVLLLVDGLDVDAARQTRDLIDERGAEIDELRLAAASQPSARPRSRAWPVCSGDAVVGESPTPLGAVVGGLVRREGALPVAQRQYADLGDLRLLEAVGRQPLDRPCHRHRARSTSVVLCHGAAGVRPHHDAVADLQGALDVDTPVWPRAHLPPVEGPQRGEIRRPAVPATVVRGRNHTIDESDLMLVDDTLEIQTDQARELAFVSHHSRDYGGTGEPRGHTAHALPRHHRLRPEGLELFHAVGPPPALAVVPARDGYAEAAASFGTASTNATSTVSVTEAPGAMVSVHCCTSAASYGSSLMRSPSAS